jgi:exodeoxyribonuclease V beta subunit
MSVQDLIPATLPLRGIKLIEASAGTGKTWTIAALYTRLILGHRDQGFEDPLTPDQILVVTFTDAATSELRDRIRSRLADAAEALSHSVVAIQDPFLRELTNGISPDQQSMLAHRLTIAADAMDDAAIFTIHGWCSRMLRQHAFDSGAPFELKIEGEEVELLNESVRDFWRIYFYGLNANDCRVIAKVAASPDELLRKIRSLLKESETALLPLKVLSIPNPKAFQDVLSRLSRQEEAARIEEAKAQSCWKQHHTEIENLILKALEQKHLNGQSYRQIEDRLKRFHAWANARSEIENSAWVGLFSKGGFRTSKAAQGIEPEHPAFDAMANWFSARVTTEALSDEFINHLLCSAAFWVRQDFSASKIRNARLDYNDLILKLHETIVQKDNQRLAEIIRNQYPVALIDEFQDTDPQQFEVFEKIYGNSNAETAWLMVGDPKQAIYGFRGADVYAYLRARRQSDAAEGGNGGIYTLPCNHRSTKALVEASNHLFLTAEKNRTRGAFNFPKVSDPNDRISYSRVTAKGRHEAFFIKDREADAMVFWLDTHGGEALPQGLYRSRMAQHCANEIVTLLNLSQQEPPRAFFRAPDQADQRLQESDIAILVRDGKEATAIREALSVRGLRSVYLSDRDSVYASREAQDLLIWLRAALNPHNGRLIRAAMATQTMGLTYVDLEQLNGDEFALDQRIAEFTGYGDLWRSHGILPAIRHLILEQSLPERLMAEPSGERTLTNLLHLAELLQTESVQHDGELGLIRFLKECIDDDQQEAKDNVLRLESDQSLIRVVTIHKSKGLEYPLVFLPFVCSYKETRTQNLSAYRYHVQDDPDHPLRLDLIKGCLDPKVAKSTMDIERLQEELRLLYVAITRARHALWLGMAPLKIGNSTDSTLHKGAMGYLLGGDQAIPAVELSERLHALMGATPGVRIESIQPAEPISIAPQKLGTLKSKPERHFRGTGFERWWIASYSALQFSKAKGDSAGPSVDPENAQEDQANEEETFEHSLLPRDSSKASHPEGIHAFPKGAKHGVFLHELLEQVAKVGFDELLEDAVARDRLIENITQSHKYGEWTETLKVWLPSFIAGKFQGEGQSLSLSTIGSRDCLTEMEFWFEAHGVRAHQLDAIFKQYAIPGQMRPSLNPTELSGVLKGFIDLVFRHQGKYYVADYKSNWLGDDAAAYRVSALQEAILEKRYDAQYCLYLLALHRYLKSRLGDQYDYDTHVGGAVYFFLRGIEGPVQGVHFEKPDRRAIEALDQLFQGSARKEFQHAG